MVKRFVIAAAVAINILSMPVAQAREPDPVPASGKKTIPPPVMPPEKKIWFEEAIDQILTGDIVGLRPVPEAPKATPRR